MAEVVRFEATGQVVGKYPDGKLYYMGDTISATMSNIQAAQQQRQAKEEQRRQQAKAAEEQKKQAAAAGEQT